MQLGATEHRAAQLNGLNPIGSPSTPPARQHRGPCTAGRLPGQGRCEQEVEELGAGPRGHRRSH
ncbi:unnamed protein product [Gulo gulo]|uniref:Uncharacterized protein n=1 Tax=Gulo gulo TaxID=48420 RepID=A0A9X9QAF1_GULGU|nr:unnamed protein product [Gulo gulo]